MSACATVFPACANGTLALKFRDSKPTIQFTGEVFFGFLLTN